MRPAPRIRPRVVPRRLAGAIAFLALELTGPAIGGTASAGEKAPPVRLTVYSDYV
jgi:hypothetical protein